jgi:hypothetical protein
MSATSVRLLQAAAEIAGGNQALAKRLGLTEFLLSAYMADRHPLPDPLLLRAVDVILEDRQFGRAQATEWNAPRLRLAGDA